MGHPAVCRMDGVAENQSLPPRIVFLFIVPGFSTPLQGSFNSVSVFYLAAVQLRKAIAQAVCCITINLDALIHRYISFSWSHKRLTVSTGRHREKKYHYIWKPPGHFWLSTPGYITFKESKNTERKKKKSWFTFWGWIESKSILRSNTCLWLG